MNTVKIQNALHWDGYSTKVSCPAHKDDVNSLAIHKADDGRILLHCFAGCSTEKILKKVGLTFNDLYPSTGLIRPESLVIVEKEPSYEVYHAAYRIFIDHLPGPSPAQQQDLIQRGLDYKQRRKYKQISEHDYEIALGFFGVSRNAHVPGLLHAQSIEGLVIPVTNERGWITALQVRQTGPIGKKWTKYKLLSSSECKAKTEPHFVGPPWVTSLEGPKLDEVRLVEGILKADICQALDPSLQHIGFMGSTTWKNVIPMLHRIGAIQTVRLCFDMDWQKNDGIKRQLMKCAKTLQQEGFKVLVETWDSKYKGLDDYLLARNREQKHLNSGESFTGERDNMVVEAVDTIRSGDSVRGRPRPGEESTNSLNCEQSFQGTDYNRTPEYSGNAHWGP